MNPQLYADPTQNPNYKQAQFNKILKYLEAQQAPTPQAKPVKQKNKGGFLTSLISEGGGGLGAAIGSLAGPLGTIAGAGIGSFIGRLGENKIRDNEFKVGSAVGEGLTSGAFAGAGQAFKAIKGAKAAKGLATALGGTDEAAQLVKGAGKSAVPGYLERKGLDKVAQAGGYFPKENVPGVGKISTNEVNKYYNVLKKLGIKPNDAGDIEKAVTDRLGKTNSIIKTQLAKADTKLAPADVTNFTDDLLDKINKTPGLTSEAKKYAAQQVKLMKGEVKSLGDLHDFRVGLDDIVNWNANPDAATAAQQNVAKILRTGIKDKLNNSVKGLADSNNLYHDLSDIQKLTLRATGRVGAEATSSGGSIGAKILSSPTANTVRAKVGGAMKEIGQYSAGTGGAITAGTSQLRRQLPADLVDAMGGAMTPQEDPNMMQETQPAQQSPLLGAMGQLAPTEQYSQPQQPEVDFPSALQQAQQLLGNDATSAQYLAYAKQIMASSKPNKVAVKAQDAVAAGGQALNIVDQLEQAYQSAGGGQGRIAGTISSLSGKAGMNNEVNIYNESKLGFISNVARALGEKGVITDYDIDRIAKLFPSPSSNPQEASAKWSMIRTIISNGIAKSQEAYGGQQYQPDQTDLASLIEQGAY